MLKILVLLCVLAAVLAAIVLQSWLRTRRGKGDSIARLIGILRTRNANYRRFQYPLTILFVVIIAIALGVGTSWINTAAYLIGAVICFAAVIVSSGCASTGIPASVNAAGEGDITTSLKASYRTGAIEGFIIAGTALLLLSMIFIGNDKFSFSGSAFAMALGASSSALFLNSGGSVYSAAYAMAASDEDFTDANGFITAFGSDILESTMISGAAAIMLAEVGVATSGITSTFTADSAAKFPLIVLACGIIASVIGILVYRGGRPGRPASSSTVPVITSGILTGAISFYFSNMILQSFVYAYTICTGIAAGIILGEVSKLFSQDSKVHIANVKSDRMLGRHASVIFNLGTGMITTVIYAAVIIAAVSVTFNFAGYYGVALAAVGFSSINITIAAVYGLSILSRNTSEIISLDTDQESELETAVSDALMSASVRSGISVKSYTATLTVISSAAMLLAIAYVSQVVTLNVISIKSFAGLIGGAAIVMLLFGLTLQSVRITGHVALRNLGRVDEEGATGSLRGTLVPAAIAVAAPAVTGLFFGLDVLISFLGGAVVAGFIVINSINNSGRHFENTAVQSLDTLIKMMLIFSAAFIPAFTRIGSFIF
ncbi:MAG: sodium/proton-translocating pyrophosphatase [Mogibacterium sp.]|nr:sodium/proton-translocating pyrophosphatase [Mogibacterium sp.]